MATASHAVFSLLPIFRKVAFSTRLTCLSATPANRLFSESYFSYDLFHAWHVGTGKTFLASRRAALSMSWARDLYLRKILPTLLISKGIYVVQCSHQYASVAETAEVNKWLQSFHVATPNLCVHFSKPSKEINLRKRACLFQGPKITNSKRTNSSKGSDLCFQRLGPANF